MAYEKNICGDCGHYSDTGRCRIPQVKYPDRSFFSKACVWFKQYQSHTDMEKLTIKNDGGEDTALTETRVCTKCGQKKPITEFQRNRWGYTKVCKDCAVGQRTEQCRKNDGKGPSSGPRAEQAGTKSDAEILADIIAEGLAKASDSQLVEELRRRGFEVTATKTITL